MVPLPDLVDIVGLALLCAAGCALAGVLLLRALRRRPLALAVAAVALVSVATTGLGVLVTGLAMFQSGHDLQVLLAVVAAAAVGGVGVAGLLGGWLARSADRLVTAAGRIGDPDSAGVASPEGPVELEVLAAALDDAHRRLLAGAEREHALEASRRELVAWVSHDLRSPLAGIRAMAEALEDEVVDPADRETVDRYHRGIRREADRLAALVDDLFELARLSAGAVELMPQPLVLGDLLSDALAGADPLARARGVRLTGRVAADGGVVGDPSRLSRVLTNLLTNAVRATPADGTVELVGEAGPDSVEISVADTCGGIPEAELPRLFDVAYRGEGARTPGDSGGGGLGLAIAREIVAAHAGEIQVTNEGRGCRFTVRLPRQPAQLAGARSSADANSTIPAANSSSAR